MNIHSEFGYFPERRLKPRFTCDYPALVQGYDENGEVFQIKGKAIDLSRIGVNIQVDRELPLGMELSISLAITTNSLKLETSSLVVHGTVVRSDVQAETIFDIAVKFQEYRFV